MNLILLSLLVYGLPNFHLISYNCYVEKNHFLMGSKGLSPKLK
jgi:hypothetical protein